MRFQQKHTGLYQFSIFSSCFSYNSQIKPESSLAAPTTSSTVPKQERLQPPVSMETNVNTQSEAAMMGYLSNGGSLFGDFLHFT